MAGAAAVRFSNAYKSFGYKDKVPLIGTTTLTDYSALPAEDPASVLGVHIASHYCDGIPTLENQKFVDGYRAQYGVFPGYYSEGGYTKARLLISALKKLNGRTSDRQALVRAMKSTPIVAPRGPVKLSPDADTPIQNVYVCEVRSVNGALRNVPVATIPNVQPWGPLSQAEWRSIFEHDSSARP